MSIHSDEKVKQIFKNYCEKQEWCTFKRFSSKEKARWDVSYFSADTQGNVISVIGEIKGKDLYPSTNRDNWLLTTAKYEALEVIKKDAIELNPDKNISLQYIHIFPDAKIWIWNIDNVKDRKEPIMRKLPKTTYFGPPVKVETPIYLMNKFEAIIREDVDMLKNE